MNLRAMLAPRSVWLDGAVVAVPLGAVNALVAWGDPGWVQLNPSPWLALPLLLGARYGFGTGVGAGVLVGFGVAGARVLSGQARGLAEALEQIPFLLGSCLVIGAVAGELFNYFHRRLAQFEAEGEQLRQRLRRLDSEVTILREAKDELDRLTAARDGEISSLDAELRRLHACPPSTLPAEVLQLLKRQARVADAALYRVPEGDAREETWVRFAVMGREEHLPPELDLREHDLAERAYQTGSLVTLPEIETQTRVDSARSLMAAPLPGADGRPRALLVVADMPFVAFTPAAANVVSLVVAWSGGVLELAEGAAGRYRLVAGMENQKVFFEPHFLHLARLAHAACRQHRLPSSLVELALPAAAAEGQAGFERVVLGAVRSGDFVMQPRSAYPSVVILLPLAGERGTDIFIERCVQHCRRQGIASEELRIRREDLGTHDSAEEAMQALAAQGDSTHG